MLMTLTMPATLDLAEEPRAARAPARVRVRSADELRTAVRHSRLQALTLDGSAMSHVLRLDAARGLIELQAATPWSDLSKYLGARKVRIDAFVGAPGLPATVGEAVSVAAPGPDGLPVTAHVRAIALVTPDGELRRADPESNAELFRAALGGRGLIGLVYSLTLAIDSLRASAAEATAPVALDIPRAGPAPTGECVIETLIPPAALEAYLTEVRALAEERRVALLAVSVRRYRKDPGAPLAWAREEWAGVQVRFGIRATLGARVAATEIRRALIAAACARGGAFLLADARDATRAQLEACYPALPAFLRDKRRADPFERLQTRWYRELLAKLRAEPCPVRWDRPD
jgi:FAD/FMN-containing dehydrogenase